MSEGAFEKELHELSYLFWECTLRCNLNYLHCGSDCVRSSQSKDLPLKDFLTVLDLIKSTSNAHKITVVLSGGEPLMRNDLEECGMEIDKREFPLRYGNKWYWDEREAVYQAY